MQGNSIFESCLALSRYFTRKTDDANDVIDFIGNHLVDVAGENMSQSSDKITEYTSSQINASVNTIEGDVLQFIKSADSTLTSIEIKHTKAIDDLTSINQEAIDAIKSRFPDMSTLDFGLTVTVDPSTLWDEALETIKSIEIPSLPVLPKSEFTAEDLEWLMALVSNEFDAKLLSLQDVLGQTIDYNNYASQFKSVVTKYLNNQSVSIQVLTSALDNTGSSLALEARELKSTFSQLADADGKVSRQAFLMVMSKMMNDSANDCDSNPTSSVFYFDSSNPFSFSFFRSGVFSMIFDSVTQFIGMISLALHGPLRVIGIFASTLLPYVGKIFEGTIDLNNFVKINSDPENLKLPGSIGSIVLPNPGTADHPVSISEGMAGALTHDSSQPTSHNVFSDYIGGNCGLTRDVGPVTCLSYVSNGSANLGLQFGISLHPERFLNYLCLDYRVNFFAGENNHYNLSEAISSEQQLIDAGRIVSVSFSWGEHDMTSVFKDILCNGYYKSSPTTYVPANPYLTQNEFYALRSDPELATIFYKLNWAMCAIFHIHENALYGIRIRESDEDNNNWPDLSDSMDRTILDRKWLYATNDLMHPYEVAILDNESGDNQLDVVAVWMNKFFQILYRAWFIVRLPLFKGEKTFTELTMQSLIGWDGLNKFYSMDDCKTYGDIMYTINSRVGNSNYAESEFTSDQFSDLTSIPQYSLAEYHSTGEVGAVNYNKDFRGNWCFHPAWINGSMLSPMMYSSNFSFDCNSLNPLYQLPVFPDLQYRYAPVPYRSILGQDALYSGAFSLATDFPTAYTYRALVRHYYDSVTGTIIAQSLPDSIDRCRILGFTLDTGILLINSSIISTIQSGYTETFEVGGGIEHKFFSTIDLFLITAGALAAITATFVAVKAFSANRAAKKAFKISNRKQEIDSLKKVALSSGSKNDIKAWKKAYKKFNFKQSMFNGYTYNPITGLYNSPTNASVNGNGIASSLVDLLPVNEAESTDPSPELSLLYEILHAIKGTSDIVNDTP